MSCSRPLITLFAASRAADIPPTYAPFVEPPLTICTPDGAVHPDPKVGRPFAQHIRVVCNDFFHMFNLPFQYGGPSDDAADKKPESVMVIDQATNQKLFGGADSRTSWSPSSSRSWPACWPESIHRGASARSRRPCN